MAATLITNTTGNKRDYVKASVATATVQELSGKKTTIDAVVIYEKEEKDDVVRVTCIRDKASGEWYTSISPTISSSMEVMIDAMSDELESGDGFDIEVKSKKSKGGRDFLYADLA